MGAIKGDTRSLDYSSAAPSANYMKAASCLPWPGSAKLQVLALGLCTAVIPD